MRNAVLLFAILATGLESSAQGPPDVAMETPVAMLEKGSGEFLRLGSAVLEAALPLQVFHSGDALRSGREPLEFLFCPQRARYELPPGTEVQFAVATLVVRSGRVRHLGSVPECALPVAPRRFSAVSLHLGESVFGALPNYETKDLVDLPGAETERPILESLARQIEANPDDARLRLARASTLERAGYIDRAVGDLKYLSKKSPGATWMRVKIFQHPQRLQAPPPPRSSGRRRALVIGISDYKQRKSAKDMIPSLKFAHRDANVFSAFAQTARGGGFQSVRVLINSQAHLPKVRAEIEDLFLNTQKEDTLLLFISAHGTSDAKQGYILTHDSHPGDLSVSALPMNYLSGLIQRSLAVASRVMVYIDACRAGMTALNNGPNQAHTLMNLLTTQNPNLLLFVSCQPGQESVESADYGGGHGAFSYYLLRGLNGDADTNRSNDVTVPELVANVVLRVSSRTPNQQFPLPFSGVNANWIIASLAGPEFPMPEASPVVGQYGQRGPEEPASRPEDVFEKARRLRDRRGQMTDEEYAAEVLRLSAALESMGQSVLVRYLEGEDAPPRREEFHACSEAFGAAADLVPESLWLEARYRFCQGRARMFAGAYEEAIAILRHSILLDPGGAYAYNALGIAYLETARYDRAIAALQEAVQKAPYWTYARNNLALAYTQRGSYPQALDAYRAARERNPSTAYVAYNQALLFQLLNRRRDAEKAWRDLIRQHPDEAKAHNALGSLYASTRRKRQAEAEFRAALESDPKLIVARYNLALLLSRNRRRVEEAMNLWRQNIDQDTRYLPSRFALAAAMEKQGRTNQAIEQYQQLLKLEPESEVARRALNRLRRHRFP